MMRGERISREQLTLLCYWNVFKCIRLVAWATRKQVEEHLIETPYIDLYYTTAHTNNTNERGIKIA
jgi:hypothetical protein